jgi:hypothetical protein
MAPCLVASAVRAAWRFVMTCRLTQIVKAESIPVVIKEKI